MYLQAVVCNDIPQQKVHVVITLPRFPKQEKKI